MGYTSYGANQVLATLVNNGTQIGLGLSSSEPSEDGTGFVEPTGNGYGRYTIVMSQNEKDFSDPSNGSVRNRRRLRFPECTGSTWGEIGYVGLFKNNTLVYYAPVAVPKTVNQDQLCKFNPGAFEITLTT